MHDCGYERGHGHGRGCVCGCGHDDCERDRYHENLNFYLEHSIFVLIQPFQYFHSVIFRQKKDHWEHNHLQK